MILAIFIMGQCKDRLSPLLFPHKFRGNEPEARVVEVAPAKQGGFYASCSEKA